jgi:uncharacterized protein (DUF1499 family)
MNQGRGVRSSITLGISLTLLVGLSACASGSGDSGTRNTLDQETGRFAPCPESPNCVSTQADAGDAEHSISPLTYSGDRADAKARIVAIVNAMPRTKIVQEEDDYLHAEFRSRIFRFVDDVEFFFDDANKTIHFRSAARVGYSDMGVNRKRMTEIGQQFNAE